MNIDDSFNEIIDDDEKDADYEHSLRSKDHNQNRVNMDYFIAGDMDGLIGEQLQLLMLL